MWKIRDQLYLGQESDAIDRAALADAEITHVVNCGRELSCPFESELSYLHIPLNDPDNRFSFYLDDVCGFIDGGRKEGAVLVHCKGAISRSPAIVLAWFCYRGASLTQAAEELGRKLPTRPQEIFIRQIAERFATSLGNIELDKLYDILAGSSDGNA